MISILFVFGTMVEFSVVLIAKQKHDWDNKTTVKNDKPLMSKSNETWRDPKSNSSSITIYDVKDENCISDNGTNEEYLTPNHILNYLTLSTNMPPYRKTDIVAFISFSCVTAALAITFISGLI